jgi:hypothetical protein
VIPGAGAGTDRAPPAEDEVVGGGGGAEAEAAGTAPDGHDDDDDGGPPPGCHAKPTRTGLNCGREERGERARVYSQMRRPMRGLHHITGAAASACVGKGPQRSPRGPRAHLDGHARLQLLHARHAHVRQLQQLLDKIP